MQEYLLPMTAGRRKGYHWSAVGSVRMAYVYKGDGRGLIRE